MVKSGSSSTSRASGRGVVEQRGDRVRRRGRRRRGTGRRRHAPAPSDRANRRAAASTALGASRPTSAVVPSSTPSHRGVERRSTTTGTPNHDASSWRPPESVTTTRAPAIASSISRYRSGAASVTPSGAARAPSRSPGRGAAARRSAGWTGNVTGPTCAARRRRCSSTSVRAVGRVVDVGGAVRGDERRRRASSRARRGGPKRRRVSVTGLPTTATPTRVDALGLEHAGGERRSARGGATRRSGRRGDAISSSDRSG